MKIREILETLGFEPVWGTMTDQEPAYRYSFGNLELSATQVTNEFLRPVFLFGGVVWASQSLSQIHFEIPLDVDSLEQGIAWIAYGLGSDFKPRIPADWITLGRQSVDELPWERELRKFVVRPQCVAEREWFRLASKRLRDMALSAGDNDVATFRFDGEVLRVEAPGVFIALPAGGKAWDRSYSIPAKKMDFLPKRYLTDTVQISVWKGRLQIGNRVFSLTDGQIKGDA